MQIDLTGICKKPGAVKTVSVTSELRSVEAGVPCTVKQFSPFDLTITNMAGSRLSVTGKTEATVLMNCDRCLNEVERTLHLRIERTYPIFEETVVPDEEDPVGGITDNILYPDELLQDELLLSLPSKVLCKENCKGLCPVCGADLNNGDCGCVKTTGSLQMAKALENIRFD